MIGFVGELIFRMSYYGILVAQRIFLAIVAIFCPIMFAVSLAPPWNSRVEPVDVEVSLFDPMGVHHIYVPVLHRLHSPLQSPAGYDAAYEHLLNGSVNSWSQIGALGLQGIGSNCMYAMGMLVGAYIIRYVRKSLRGSSPEVLAAVSQVRQAHSRWVPL